jgi:hypothetical protein
MNVHDQFILHCYVLWEMTLHHRYANKFLKRGCLVMGKVAKEQRWSLNPMAEVENLQLINIVNFISLSIT